MKVSFFTKNPNQTKKLGKILAQEILKNPLKKRALILGLEGDLGGGKTTFLQGFAKGLGVKEKITSPTFVIIKKFHVPYSVFHEFYHIDCYRIKRSKEILDLGFKKIISDSQNIMVIEWSDRIKKILPKDALFLKFDFINKNIRKIVLKYYK